MIKSLQCVVSGKVQGVFFRAWIHDHAAQLGLTGWVRNVSEGKVEVLAQGPTEALDELKRLLLTGSELSRVENVDSKWIDYDKQHDTFQIRS